MEERARRILKQLEPCSTHRVYSRRWAASPCLTARQNVSGHSNEVGNRAFRHTVPLPVDPGVCVCCSPAEGGNDTLKRLRLQRELVMFLDLSGVGGALYVPPADALYF